MLIETTIHIQTETLKRLTRAAVLTGNSRRSIISALLRRFADDNTKFSVQWSRVKYQGRDVRDNWQRLHLVLNPDEYEFILDLRKVFKRSVSACVADAIDKYLGEILKSINKNIDNYRFRNYAFSRVIVDDVVCWILYWGIPRQFLTQPDSNQTH